MHAREAIALADELAAADPAWAEVFADPGARDALVLGSVTPDFRQVVDALPFGHLRTLGYHLVDASVGGTPTQRAFALGYLAHVVSDHVADTFVGPGLWSMHALGPFDLVVDEPETLVAETELICETFGDLVNGDWHAVVDALVTYRNGGEAGRNELNALMGWYCAEAAEHTGLATDCELARAQLETVLLRVDDLIGSFTRSGAHALIDVLLDQAPIDLLPLFTGGALSSLLGDTFAFGPHSEAELLRFEHSALVDEEFWALYDAHWADLAPTLTRVQLERRSDGWPRRHNNALRGGNWISAFRFLDAEWWADGQGLIVEGVAWESDGTPLRQLPELTVSVRGTGRVSVFATRPFRGEVLIEVFGDRPGLDQWAVGDRIHRPAFGSSVVALDLDPARSVDEGLTVLEVPFEVPAGHDLAGLVVDVSLRGQRPFFSSNAEPLWTQPSQLPMWQPNLRRLLTTYGEWPGSLPAAGIADSADLVVVARVAPDGDGVEGALVEVVPGYSVLTGTHGLAAVGSLLPGLYDVYISADGYREEARIGSALPAGQTELEVFLTPWLEPSAPPFVADPRCIPLTWNSTRWGSVLPSVQSRVVDRAGATLAPETSHGRTDPVRVCTPEPLPDGSVLRIEVQARPSGGEPTEWESTGDVTIDTSAPEIPELGVDVTEEPGCVASVPELPAARIRVVATDPHSGVDAGWVDALDARGQLVFSAPLEQADEAWVASWDEPVPNVVALSVGIRNRAGLTAVVGLDAPLVDDVCPEPGPEPVDAGDAEPRPDGGDAAAGEDDAAPQDSGAGEAEPSPGDAPARSGCSAAPAGGAGPLLLLLAAIVGRRRQIRVRRPGMPWRGRSVIDGTSSGT